MNLASWSVSGEFAVIRYATLADGAHPSIKEYDAFINEREPTPFNIIKYDPYHYYKTGESRLINDEFIVKLINSANAARQTCDLAAIQQQMPDFIVYETLETMIGRPDAIPSAANLMQCYAEVRRKMRHMVTRFGVDIVGDMYHDKFYARNMLRIEFIYALQQYVGNLKLARELLTAPIGGLIIDIVGDKYKIALWADENIESQLIREKLYQIKDVAPAGPDVNYFLIDSK